MTEPVDSRPLRERVKPEPAPLSEKWAAMPREPSTSERLRQTQQALAASQADLTRVELEHHKGFNLWRICCRDREQIQAELSRVELERDGVREELARQAEANEDLTVTLGVRTGDLRRAHALVDALSTLLLPVARAAGCQGLRLDEVEPAISGLLTELALLRAQLHTPLHTEEPPA